ncbi:MAG: hypothetical protein IJC15_07730 [Clostridia bacterium]|nr:hypothetical protein [Clostridia bacterium]
MKRRFFCWTAILLCTALFGGCKSREIIPLEYTSTVVIDSELPDASLVWAGRFQTPTSGMGLFNLAESAFFGVVRSGEIAVHALIDQRELAPSYHTGSLWKLLGWKGEEYRARIGMYIDRSSYFCWEDAVLFHFYVEEDNQYEGKPVTYAGQQVLIEYRPDAKNVYFHALTQTEYRDDRPGTPYSLYQGRIGDKVYFRDGWYSLTEHRYTRYATEDDLPAFGGTPFSTVSLADAIKADPRLQEYVLDERLIWQVDSMARLGDRLYATAVIGDRYYESDPMGEFVSYAGTELWLFMADSASGEILYAEKLQLANYWQGSSALSFYRMSADGRLYDAFLP